MIDPFNAATFSPEKKLEFIQQQILAVRANQASWVLCPYCGHENTPVDTYLCCERFAEASSAIMDRIEKQEAIDFLAQVQDKVN
jgi:hypothetical protein